MVTIWNFILCDGYFLAFLVVVELVQENSEDILTQTLTNYDYYSEKIIQNILNKKKNTESWSKINVLHCLVRVTDMAALIYWKDTMNLACDQCSKQH